MPGRSSAQRLAAARIEQAVMCVFEGAGFEHIAPDILQPADIFLERSGEDIRTHSFVFTDPSGAEVCLRPDLTVPACRYFLAQSPPQPQAQYCYCGAAFRYAGGSEPAEVDQTGIEWLGGGDAELAEARVLKLAIAAIEAAGIRRYRVQIGDLALFRALIDDFEIPERWRRRLKHHFWRPQAFRELIDFVSGDAIRLRSSISAHVDAIAGRDAVGWVEAELEAQQYPLIGGRSIAEIAQRLQEKALDRSERPLSRPEARRIHDYLAIAGAPQTAATAFVALEHGKRFGDAAARFQRRDSLMQQEGLDTKTFHFDATFGRSLEYYTGFVFQIEAETAEGPITLAGGGRYDDLLSDIGSPEPVPAVGCALYTQSLLKALT